LAGFEELLGGFTGPPLPPPKKLLMSDGMTADMAKRRGQENKFRGYT
jgi:hypothetical protein